MDIKNKKIAIIGAGRSGLAAARFCQSQGGYPVVNDLRARDELAGQLEAFEEIRADLRLGSHDPKWLEDCDGVILSPGVSPNLDVIRVMRERGVPIIGEMELASRYTKVPIVAVTGTNGKSTTVTLIHSMLEASHRRSGLGGNIGTPFLDLINSDETYDVFVIEVSSYQLETIETFRPHVAVLLNISPDHLSRHQSISSYAFAKSRIFMNQGSENWAVYNADDPHVESAVVSVRSRKIPFSLRRPISPGLFRQRDQIIWFHEGHQESYDLSQFALIGDHQIENAMASVAASKLVGATIDGIQKTLDVFHGLPHRFELVGSMRSVYFINDSKATNVGAAIRAVQGVPEGHLILIAGGEEKGSSYDPLRDILVERRAKAICVYGEAAGAMQEAFGMHLPTFRHTTLEEAFSQALSQAEEEDFIVLAPACASFDQFSNYEHRGNTFRQLVAQLCSIESRVV